MSRLSGGGHVYLSVVGDELFEYDVGNICRFAWQNFPRSPIIMYRFSDKPNGQLGLHSDGSEKKFFFFCP